MTDRAPLRFREDEDAPRALRLAFEPLPEEGPTPEELTRLRRDIAGRVDEPERLREGSGPEARMISRALAAEEAQAPTTEHLSALRAQIHGTLQTASAPRSPASPRSPSSRKRKVGAVVALGIGIPALAAATAIGLQRIQDDKDSQKEKPQSGQPPQRAPAGRDPHAAPVKKSSEAQPRHPSETPDASAPQAPAPRHPGPANSAQKTEAPQSPAGSRQSGQESPPQRNVQSPLLEEPAKEKASSEPPVDPMAELALMRRARAALDTPSQALALIEEHRTRFPRGVLIQERELLRIEALVKLGRSEQARAAARRFRRSYPQSAHLSRIDRLVGGTKENAPEREP